jgi:hypothetical protein
LRRYLAVAARGGEGRESTHNGPSSRFELMGDCNTRSGLNHDVLKRLAAREAVEIAGHRAPAPLRGRKRLRGTAKFSIQDAATYCMLLGSSRMGPT